MKRHFSFYLLLIISSNLISQNNVPDKLFGSWHLIDNNSQHIITLYDKVVVYDSHLYNNFSLSSEKKKWILNLENDKITLVLKDTVLTIKTENGVKYQCCKVNSAPPHYKKGTDCSIDFIFGLDTAVYKGYIQNYSPEDGKTGTMYLNKIFPYNYRSSSMEIFIIDESGYFEVRIPLYHPIFVGVSLPNRKTYNMLLVPGEELIQIVNYSHNQYFGKHARLSYEIQHYRDLDMTAYSNLNRKSKTIDKASYIASCSEAYQNTIDQWIDVSEKYLISPTMQKLGKQFLKIEYGNLLLYYLLNKTMYKMIEERAGKAYSYQPFVESDYAFYNDLSLNDPSGLIYSGYASFIRKNIMRGLFVADEYQFFDYDGFAQLLTDKGIELSESQIKTIAEYDTYNNLDFVKRQTVIINSHYDLYLFMEKKYRQVIKEYDKVEHALGYYTGLKAFLKKDSTVFLMDDEIDFLDLLSETETPENINFQLKYEQTTQNSIEALKKEYINYYIDLKAIQDLNYQRQKMKQVCGEEGALLADVLASVRLVNVHRTKELNDYLLQYVEYSIKTPFIKDYILSRAEQIKKQLETPKEEDSENKGVSNIGFDKILAKYKGKVVYVDFWATWCGPCQMGIKTIAPLKKELADRDDIVFHYITNTTSPENLWSKYIIDVKGEHYRLSKDEWNQILDRYDCSSIPHYLLVNKNGSVINNDDDISPENSKLKSILLKYADE